MKISNSFQTCCLLVLLAIGGMNRSMQAATTLTGGAAFGAPGQSVSVAIDLLSDATLVGVQLDISFDAGVLEVTSIGRGAILEPGHVIESAALGSGSHRLLVYSNDNLSIADGEMVSVNFNILPAAVIGPASVGISSVLLADPAAAAVDVDSIDDGDVTVSSAVVEVVGRHLFYNDSAFDLTSDSDAIATDKQALLPGGQAGFVNYASYTRGINGVIVDIAELANPSNLGVGDFDFRRGNTDDVGTWGATGVPSGFVVSEGGGAGGADRVLMTWANNNLDGTEDPNEAVAGEWLEVTVKSNANTGLSSDSKFYFGNAPGEVGNNSGVDANVTIADVFEVFTNQSANVNAINTFDHDHSGAVTISDLFFTFTHQVAGDQALRQIDLSGVGATSIVPLSFESAEFINSRGLVRMLAAEPGDLNLEQLQALIEADANSEIESLRILESEIGAGGGVTIRLLVPGGEGRLLYSSRLGRTTWELVPEDWISTVEDSVYVIEAPFDSETSSRFFKFEPSGASIREF